MSLSAVERVVGQSAFRQQGNVRHQRQIVKTVVDFLKANRAAPATAAILKTSLGVDLTPELSDDLSKNPRVQRLHDNSFVYRPVHAGLANKNDLLAVIEANERGIFLDELLDAYLGADKDLEDLIDNDVVIRVANLERKADVLYPRDPRHEVEVDEEIQKLWSEISMPPSESALEERMLSLGLITVEQLREHKAHKQQTKVVTAKTAQAKQQRKRKRTKITNKHLIEQLPWLAPPT